jgi:hypothetical protein
MESELSSLRIRVLDVEDRERKRAKAWKLTQTIVGCFVIGLALTALGMLAFSSDRKGVEFAITLLLVNTPLMFLAQTLMTGSAHVPKPSQTL